MSLRARLVTLLLAVGAGLALVAFVLFHFLLPLPPTLRFTAERIPATGGKAVNLTIQIDPENDASSTPGWPSYFVRDVADAKWVRSTIWQLPAHTRINVTAYSYDGCTPLRNQFWGHVTGTSGGTAYVNGKAQSLSNSYSQCSVAHTFTVPQLGIDVPIPAETATNLCSQAPCSPSAPHQVLRFSFTTPGPGDYHWQCFIPCGLGFVDGNGGPMSTLGFMSGFLKVVSA